MQKLTKTQIPSIFVTFEIALSANWTHVKTSEKQKLKYSAISCNFENSIEKSSNINKMYGPLLESSESVMKANSDIKTLNTPNRCSPTGLSTNQYYLHNWSGEKNRQVTKNRSTLSRKIATKRISMLNNWTKSMI